MRLLIAILIACCAVAATPAYASDDPFAALEPMNEEALKDARGGFQFDDGFVEVGALFFRFGLEFSGEAKGPNGEVNFASTDDLSRTILFNNSVNDVRLTSTVTFNVAIDNYNQALAQNAASSIAAGVLSNALLLSAPQN